MSDSAVLLVHGLWHGAWSWDLVGDLLDAAGVDSTSVDLPMTSLDDDVAVVRHFLDVATSPVILVGHSYGGAVITAVGRHPALRRLVYLAAFQLTEAESISRTLPDLEIAPTRLGDFLRFSDDGKWVSLDPAGARELMYGGAPSDTADAAVARMRPVARALFAGRPDNASWRYVPSTYVICGADLTVAPDLQRAMAGRADEHLEWECGHTPQASDPGLVADLIVELATGHD